MKMVDEKFQLRPEPKHTRAEIRAFKGKLAKIYKFGDELEFMRWLREIGYKDEHPTFVAALKHFRDAKRGKL
jgi:hypothetical protein